MTSFSRILKYGWLGFWRNPWVSFATIGIMILALSVVSALLVVGNIAETFVKELQGKVDVSVYFDQEAEEVKILSLKEALEVRSDVRSVEYISRDEALGLFEERHEEDEILMTSLDELDSNPFQASLNIKANIASQFDAIVSFIEGSQVKDIVDKINYKQNEVVINKITNIASSIGNIGMFFTFALSFVAVVITFNTIRLVIYTYRDEISVMKLVGASNWFIRGPFIVAGMLYGIFASILTWIGIFIVLWILSDKAIVVFPGTDIFAYWAGSALWTFSLLLFFGVALGIFSSSVAISRYLKA